MTYTDRNNYNHNELYSLALLGLQRKYEHQKRIHAVKRLKEEFEVIFNNGLVSLFFDALTVRTWIEEQQIMCAPGYAHLPSSLLAYVLDLTRIDPLHNRLYFERFFNTTVDSEPFIKFVIPPDDIPICESFIKSLENNSKIMCLGCECIKSLKRFAFSVNQVPRIKKSIMHTIAEGKTHGIEPVNEEKWTDLLISLQPDTLDELINLWTLSRPGLDILIPSYLDRKKSKDNIAYPHPDLIPIFKSTLGLCLFQEQIIETLSTVCRFSPAKAECIRRILAKKKYSATEEIKTELIRAFRNKGYSFKEAMTVFEYLYKNAGIAYCKAHASAEARLHYESAISLEV